MACLNLSAVKLYGCILQHRFFVADDVMIWLMKLNNCAYHGTH